MSDNIRVTIGPNSETMRVVFGPAATLTTAGLATLDLKLSKSGTPLDNQVGVWTASEEMEGDAGLTYDSTTGLTLKKSLVLGELGNAGHIHLDDGAGGAGVEIDATADTLTVGGTVNATGLQVGGITVPAIDYIKLTSVEYAISSQWTYTGGIDVQSVVANEHTETFFLVAPGGYTWSSGVTYVLLPPNSSMTFCKRSVQDGSICEILSDVVPQMAQFGLVNAKAYRALGDGVTNDRTALSDADAVEPVFLSPGTYLASSNLTLTKSVSCAVGAKLKPANGITITLSDGYVAEDTQQVFDVSAGGVIAVRKQSYLNIMHFGAIGDYSYPASGTDDYAAIQACFDAASAMATAEGGRAMVIMPPGEYKVMSFLTLPYNVDLDMTGATIQYRGSLRTDAILTIDGSTTIVSSGSYKGITIQGHYGIPDFSVSEASQFACLKITGMASSNVEINGVSAAAIGVLLFSAKDKYIAHNRFYGVNAAAVKTGLEMRGNYSVGWVNENDFYGSNFSLTSSADPLGSLTGVKITAKHQVVSFDHTTDVFTLASHGLDNGDYMLLYSDKSLSDMPAGFDTTSFFWVVNKTTNTFQLSASLGGSAVTSTTNPTGNLYIIGYPGQNNNRFYGTCFQVNDHVSSLNLSIGTVVVAGSRYVNLSLKLQYYCTVGGTVATVPTHTSGVSAADANGVRFEYESTYARTPVWVDMAGGKNKFYGCRWESGYGPFFRSTVSPSLGIVNSNNEFEVYDLDAQAATNPVMGYFQDATSNTVYFENKFKLFAQSDSPPTALNSIHKRAVGASGKLCIAGMYFQHISANTRLQYVTPAGAFTLCRDSLFCDVGSYHFGVIVDLRDYEAAYMSFSNLGVLTQGRLWAYFLDADYDVVIPASISDVSVGLSGGGLDHFESTWGGWATQSDGAKSGHVRRNPSNATVKYAFMGFSYNGAEVSSLSVLPIQGGGEGNLGRTPIRIFTPYEPDSLRGARFSHGTPDVGYFESAGEFIGNINTAGGQPVGWYVTTPGILAPAWAGNTVVRAGELRLSDTNKIYAAQSAGTTANPGTAPTGTGSGIDDGDIMWDYVGAKAVLASASIPTTSAELRTLITDETGTGALVFADSPTLQNRATIQGSGSVLTLEATYGAGSPTIDLTASGIGGGIDTRIVGGYGSDTVIAFFTGGASLVERMRIKNAGILVTGSIEATSSIGYSAGAGGTVTQVTSRTTGVTLHKACGAITLVSAAGSATPASFTVANNFVATTDVVVVSQKSGTDKYVVLVTAVGNGSFEVTSYTTGGTTTEQPVFSFAVVKGVAA